MRQNIFVVAAAAAADDDDRMIIVIDAQITFNTYIICEGYNIDT